MRRNNSGIEVAGATVSRFAYVVDGPADDDKTDPVSSIVGTQPEPQLTTFHNRSKSVIDNEKQVENLIKEKEILEKSNKSQFRKTTLQVNKLNKKVEK